MRILGGIPSRLRHSSGKLADILAKVCDEVVIISQKATVECKSSNIVVIEKDVNFGICNARTAIDEYAIANGFDLIVESDDDLSYKPDLVESLVREIVNNPTLGSCGAFSRMYFNWNKKETSNKNFILYAGNACLWCARVSALQEVGRWNCECAEDLDHGLKMWQKGLAVASLKTTLSQTFSMVSCQTDTLLEGGYDREDREQRMWKSLDTIGEDHANLVYIGAGNGNRRFSTRYNWSVMTQKVVDRFGYALEYEDSKGRKL